jgi:hypothetical protein
MIRKDLLFLTLLAITIFVGCNLGARMSTHEHTHVLPCGEKMDGISWRNSDLWVSSRPFRPGEVPKNHTFRESAEFGMGNSIINVIESKCP